MYRKGDGDSSSPARPPRPNPLEHSYDAPYLPRMDMTTEWARTRRARRGDLVCSVGATAKMFCLDKLTGKPAWATPLWESSAARASTSAIRVAPSSSATTVIVQVGGAGHASSPSTGATVTFRWKAHDFRNSSFLALVIDVDGQEQLSSPSCNNEVVGLDPQGGALLWRHPVSAGWDFISHQHAGLGRGQSPVRRPPTGWRARPAPQALLRRADAARELWQSDRTRVHTENAVVSATPSTLRPATSAPPSSRRLT